MNSPIACRPRPGIQALAVALMAAPSLALACSTCPSTLSSDWASQGLSAKPGLDVDLRVDVVPQDDLRSGTRRVDRGRLPVPSEQEIQRDTSNRDATLTLEEGIDDDWGVALQVPYHDRRHSTLAEGDTSLSSSRSSSLGDLRVTARYQGFAHARDWGVQAGLKLPTGRTDVAFREGPRAGEPLDRGLQPGSGTTDLLLGAFRFGPLARDLDYSLQAGAQLPLDSHDGFRPGIATTVTAAVRYLADGPVSPHLQVNVRREGRERGPAADAANSGSTLVNAGVGATWAVSHELHAYAFMQLPLLQRVNGLQIEPRYAVTVGVRYTR